MARYISAANVAARTTTAEAAGPAPSVPGQARPDGRARRTKGPTLPAIVRVGASYVETSRRLRGGTSGGRGVRASRPGGRGRRPWQGAHAPSRSKEHREHPDPLPPAGTTLMAGS